MNAHEVLHRPYPDDVVLSVSLRRHLHDVQPELVLPDDAISATIAGTPEGFRHIREVRGGSLSSTSASTAAMRTR
jgi:hypothetical protein